MEKYQGCIIEAFETVRNDDSGEEIHILEFPSNILFEKYRMDPSLLELVNLRDKAILKTTIKVSQKIKSYT